ncbi:MAG: M42 family metallopeptidase [Candidatus Bipolaricaulota bacterium]|nr:M42 family metallopeptidase [Candidatus Bipolaricaulota bacterium]
MQPIELLRELSDAFGVSGFEDEVREVLRARVAPFVDDVSVDTLGNLIAVRHGKDKRVMMLDAHMDEVGFLVKWVDDKGYVRFAPIGGWDERIVPGHRVVLVTRNGEKRFGVIGCAPPHILSEEERHKPIPMEKMFVDFGATSRQEATDLGIQIGDPFTIHYPFGPLCEGYVTGKALDDRAGCAVLVEAARRLADRKPSLTLAFAFVFGEEVGLRGAKTAAFHLDPSIALAVEGTIGADMPGVPEESQPTRLGRGPAISVADRSIIVSPKVVRALERVADAESIPYQYKLPTYGGTDAGSIHLSRGGVLTGIVSVPCRFIHSPVSTLRLNDFENTIRLVTSFVRTLPGDLL